MSTLPLKPERLAQLEAYAQRHGKDTVTALDDVLADYFDANDEEYADTVKAVTEAWESVKAGRTQPLDEFLEDLRIEHGFPR